MQQKKIKLSERTKNTIIIALAAAIALSLIINAVASGTGTEAEAAVAAPGSISAEIRGSGTVESNASLDVTSEYSCTLLSVPVAVGDTVNAGDVLAECIDVSAETAEKLKGEIDELMLKYKQDLIDKSEGRFTTELAAIDKAQAALTKAKADCEKLLVTDAELGEARTRAENCAAALVMQEDEIARLQALGGSSTLSVEQAEEELRSVMMVYSEDYSVLVGVADSLMEEAGLKTDAEKDNAREQYLALAVTKQKEHIDKLNEENPGPLVPFAVIDEIKKAQASIDAYGKVKPAQDKLKLAQRLGGLKAAQEKLLTLTAEKSTADTALERLEAKRKEWETAEDGLEAYRDAVDTATEALAKAQKEGQKEDIQLAADEEKINAKKKELEALENGGEATRIVSRAHGVISAISATAGSSIQAGAAIMTIEVTDLGYTVSVPVTLEQSKLVQPGAIAEVSSGEISAVLQEIKNDPDNPGRGRLLVFELTGEAEPGEQLDLSVGSAEERYELVIPQSALREDSQGGFVLRVTPKRGLFGMRYVCQRVPVEVKARDDESVAVSGELYAGDMVITTHPLEISSGDAVKLSE